MHGYSFSDGHGSFTADGKRITISRSMQEQAPENESSIVLHIK